jgi:hypothetical protein
MVLEFSTSVRQERSHEGDLVDLLALIPGLTNDAPTQLLKRNPHTLLAKVLEALMENATSNPSVSFAIVIPDLTEKGSLLLGEAISKFFQLAHAGNQYNGRPSHDEQDCPSSSNPGSRHVWPVGREWRQVL